MKTESLPLCNPRLLFRKGKKHQVQETFEALFLAVLAALVIRAFVIQAFRIPTASMEDSLLVGDFLLVNKFIYGSRVPLLDIRIPGVREPRSGDIIVFKYPLDESKDYIKRCIAGPGQTVEIRDKVIYLDGTVFPNPPGAKFIDSQIYSPEFREFRSVYQGLGNRDNFGPITVPDGMFFALGDNRDNSEDSRYWGFVPRKNIIGEALIIYFSWNSRRPLYQIFQKIRWMRIGNFIH